MTQAQNKTAHTVEWTETSPVAVALPGRALGLPEDFIEYYNVQLTSWNP